MGSQSTLAILGAGNIGRAIALGLTASGRYGASQIILTRRRTDRLHDLDQQGFGVQSDNCDAVRRSSVVVLAVEPQQLNGLLAEIAPQLDPRVHLLISVVSGASIADILKHAGQTLPVVRAMPNTAIALRQSMTCIAAGPECGERLDEARSIFDAVGTTLAIEEDQMVPATALCACGIAFFLRAVRAASQGGIEIGFQPEEALRMAAQTALGAASLVLDRAQHPEREIDRVTTPRGCTISGLNQMEHEGFSSALIKGITTSAQKADHLYRSEQK